MLSIDQIQRFLHDGILVIPNTIDNERVTQIRQQFHQYLLNQGCDINRLNHTANILNNFSSTNGSGKLTLIN